jgi:hypothetical protein
MAHNFSTVNSTTNTASDHTFKARTAAGNIGDATTREAVQAVVEAVGNAIDAINQLVEALQ